jgi:ankyrin repeat protein
MSSEKPTTAQRGTTGYRAPELFDPVRPQFSNRSDIFALGCILHELVTGRAVFIHDFETYQYTMGSSELPLRVSYPDMEFWHHHVSEFLRALMSKAAHQRPNALGCLLQMSVYACVVGVPNADVNFETNTYPEWKDQVSRAHSAEEALFNLVEWCFQAGPEGPLRLVLIKAVIRSERGTESEPSELTADVSRDVVTSGVLWRKYADVFREIGQKLLLGGEAQDAVWIYNRLSLYSPQTVHLSLHRAVANNDAYAIESLVLLGQNVNDGAYVGWTPMHEAAAKKHVEAIKLLVTLGGDVNSRDIEGLTPIFVAVIGEDLDILKLLIELGADVNGRDREGGTPMHAAAWKGVVNVIRVLAELGGKVDGRDDEGWAPMHAAAWGRRPKAIELLAELGGNVNVRSNRGTTPMYAAAWAGGVEAIRTLVKLGGDVNGACDLGWIPMHAAALRGHVDAIKLLTELGGDVNRRGPEGQTPLYVATQQQQLEALSALEDLGALL